MFLFPPGVPVTFRPIHIIVTGVACLTLAVGPARGTKQESRVGFNLVPNDDCSFKAEKTHLVFVHVSFRRVTVTSVLRILFCLQDVLTETKLDLVTTGIVQTLTIRRNVA